MIPVNKTIWDLRDGEKEEVLQEGNLLHMSSGEKVLVGYINCQGGVCGECLYDDGNSTILGYEIVWRKTK